MITIGASPSTPLNQPNNVMTTLITMSGYLVTQ